MAAHNAFPRRQGPVGIIALTVLAAIVVNLAMYGVATAMGATFDFTDRGEAYHVYALTLFGFTGVPLLIGLALVAVLGRLWRGVYPVALFIAPLIAIATIFTMTIPADLDTASTVALAAAHIVVGIAAAGGITALRRPIPTSAFRMA